MSGYEVIERETTVRIACPSGGFDVQAADDKINVSSVHAIIGDGTLVEILVVGRVYKADGKIGQRIVHENVWPNPHTEPDSEDFLPWTVLPSNLQQVIVTEAQR